MPPLVSYEDALETVIGACAALGTETVPLAEALGRVLASVPTVAQPVPPFANSAMDGFAVRHADASRAGVSLRLGPEVPAGTTPPPLVAGHAMPIATGAPIPDGADAVVPIEQARVADAAVTFDGPVPAGQFVRPAGSDLPAGPAPLQPGVPLDPAAGALLATVGATRVEVVRRPRVAILSTGAELVPPDRVPGPAQIRDSNSLTLTWACRDAGADPRPLGIAPDDAAGLRPLLELGLDADMLITSAGVSVGERDLVRGCLAELGVEHRLWGVDIKPGKPLALGVHGRRVVLSLPGNPASSLVCFTLFALPAIRALGGWAEPRPRLATATAAGAWPAAERRLHAVRCVIEEGPGGALASPTGDQGSHRIGSLVGADALALVEPGRAVSAGEPVRIVRS